MTTSISILCTCGESFAVVSESLDHALARLAEFLATHANHGKMVCPVADACRSVCGSLHCRPHDFHVTCRSGAVVGCPDCVPTSDADRSACAVVSGEDAQPNDR